MFPFIETSRSRGKPVKLLFFKWGEHANAVAGYTTAERAIEFQPQGEAVPRMFLPQTADVPSQRASGTLDKTRIEFGLPKSCPVLALYRVYPPSHITTLRVYEGHLDDPDNDFRLVWSGRVLGVQFDTPTSNLICEPASSAARRVCLRLPYQIMCPRVLYSADCGADQNAATTIVEVGDVATTSLSVADGVLPRDPQQYFGGVVRWCAARGDVIRTIVGVEEAFSGGEIVLHLNGPTTDLEMGAEAYIVRGCDHTLAGGCAQHNNQPNYGGFPFIPTENPIGTPRNFYT